MTSGFTHGGDTRKLALTSGLPEDRIIDFSASLNPLGFPEWLRTVISSKVSSLSRYPDPSCSELGSAVSAWLGVDENMVVAGAGATELLFAIARAGDYGKAVIPEPGYVDYRNAAQTAGLKTTPVLMTEANRFDLDFATVGESIGGNDLVMTGNPNNPTGKILDSDSIRALAAQHPDTLFVVDESFAGFVEGFVSLTAETPPNVVVIMSLTKLFAIPGLRLGVAVANVGLADQLRKALPPWSVNTLAQAVGARAVADTGYQEMTIRKVKLWREDLRSRLRSINSVTVYESAANFVLCKVDHPKTHAKTLALKLLEKGIAIRVCDDYKGLDNRFFRVAVRRPADNEKLEGAIRGALGVSPGRRTGRAAPNHAIMIQGVSSNSGKSVVAAAFCRIMKQDGFRVAPFKAQNMALNSYVTLDGKEIGRAQAVQAQACGLEPDTLMNPILLKPNSDIGAQVIVMGEPAGLMNVGQYSAFKSEAFEIVKKAYDSLAKDYDAVVMEGAGSPAEVNLKSEDIVNMRMARHAGAKALIVGDIDRGGMFASFIGCLETMAEWERDIVAGFLINKFRGEAGLLHSAMDYTLRQTGVQTLGVIPFIHDMGLPEEDMAKIRHGPESKMEKEFVKIAIVKLRHTSNFTDFDPLMIEPDVRVVAASRPEDLEGVDAIIIPGSKNVIGDLAQLRHDGIAARLGEISRRGQTEIIGICGGFQAMGLRLFDPDGVESFNGDSAGLGLLSIETTFARDKTLARVEGKHLDSGLIVNGYEIHHGRTDYKETIPLIKLSDGKIAGVRSVDGNIWGTYLHGLFNGDRFRRWFIDRLRVRKGLHARKSGLTGYDPDLALDRLADVVRDGVDVEGIYALMGLR